MGIFSWLASTVPSDSAGKGQIYVWQVQFPCHFTELPRGLGALWRGRTWLSLFGFCMCVYWQLAHTECPEQEKWRVGLGGCLWQIHVLSCVTHGHVIKLWEYKTQCQKPPSKWLRLFCSLSSDAQRRHFLRKDLDSLGASYTPCLPVNHVLMQEGTESKVRCARWSINWPDDMLWWSICWPDDVLCGP